MVYCVASGCNNCTGKRKKPGKKLHFFTFPRDKNLRQVWIKLLKRERYDWKEGHKLCSEHFDKSQYEVDPERMAEFGYPNAKARLKEDAVPKFNYSARVRHMKPHPITRPKERGAKRRKMKVNIALIFPTKL